VGTFCEVALKTFTCRASMTKTLAIGFNSFPVDLEIVKGDWLGCYWNTTNQYIREVEYAAPSDAYYITGEYIDPGDSFAGVAYPRNIAICLRGIGK
jgi:hypothetical protein